MVKHAAYIRLISFHKNKSLSYAEFDYEKLGPTRMEQEFLLKVSALELLLLLVYSVLPMHCVKCPLRLR